MAEAGRRRAKRSTYQLDEKVKARLRGDDCGLAGSLTSSGSQHEGCELSGLFFFFSDDDDEDAAAAGGFEGGEDEHAAGSDGEGADRSLLPPVSMPAMVRELLGSSAGEDRFGRDLAADVTEAVERLDGMRSCRPVFQRAVMSALREAGYNAGICKARWNSNGGVGGGSYEYIDVVGPPGGETCKEQQRYVVDVEFAAEFEIARQTAEYRRVAAELPRVYVGKPEELRRLLRLLAAAARRSLLTREMHVPPWRMGRYMQAKWLGPHRRTQNPAPSVATQAATAVSAAPPPPSFAPGRDVKFRCVGFDAAASRQLTPAAARAR